MGAAQNPTIINTATNQGVQQYPSNRHTGVVTLGLKTNGVSQFYVLTWTNNSIVWLPATNSVGALFLLRAGDTSTGWQTFVGITNTGPSVESGPFSTPAGTTATNNAVTRHTASHTFINSLTGTAGAYFSASSAAGNNASFQFTLPNNGGNLYSSASNFFGINSILGPRAYFVFQSNGIAQCGIYGLFQAAPTLGLQSSGAGSIDMCRGNANNSAGSGGILMYNGGLTLLGYFANSVAGMQALNATIVSNANVRGQAVTVSGLSTVTNTFQQYISGTVVGSTNITFPTAFTSLPKIFISHADANGTSILNDQFGYTNKSLTGCTITTRTSAGLVSSVALDYDLMAAGNQ